MIHNLKALSVAICAVVALTAVAATAATAAKSTASIYPTTGTSESAPLNDVFQTEAPIPAECKSHFEGTLTAASANLTVKAKYTECKAFGFVSATVNMKSCDYFLQRRNARCRVIQASIQTSDGTRSQGGRDPGPGA